MFLSYIERIIRVLQKVCSALKNIGSFVSLKQIARRRWWTSVLLVNYISPNREPIWDVNCWIEKSIPSYFLIFNVLQKFSFVIIYFLTNNNMVRIRKRAKKLKLILYCIPSKYKKKSAVCCKLLKKDELFVAIFFSYW